MNTYHATKYDSARDEVIALLSDEAEGYGIDSAGNVDAPGGYLALVFLFDRPTACEHPGHGPQAHAVDIDFGDTTGAYPAGDLVGETAREYGVTAADVRGAHIVTHSSQGFVSVETFETEAEARAEFDCRAARYAEWDAHGETCGTPDAWSGCPSTWDASCDWDGLYLCPVQGHGYHTL